MTKKILALDTETTGFIKMDISPDNILQPWPVQIAAILAGEDGVKHSTMNFLVNPPIPIEPGAMEAHGITQERAREYGLKPITAVTMLYSLIARADVIVGHNLDFDVNIIKLAKLRLGIAHQSDLFDGREHFCTQKNSAHIINLAPTEKMVKAGMHEVPKSPKLSEAFKFFFNEEIVGAHDALVDTEAALRIYLRIKHLRAPGTNNVI